MKLVFATHNFNKAKELSALISSSIELITLNDLHFDDDIPETADTLEGNAELKATFIKRNFGLDCFADDTGLEVFALQNAPGVHSARYAGNHKSDEENIDLLLENLKHVQDRTARFRTSICLKLGDSTHFFEGIVNGQIIHERRGDKGFGYDSIFVPDGENRSFAQMEMRKKNSLSHRGQAFEKMIHYLASL